MRKIFFVFVAALCFIFPSQAFAYNTFNAHKLQGGVGDYGNDTQYYYVDSSASTYESSYIDPAWSDWIYTTSRLGITTPISFRQTTSLAYSVVDMYATNGPTDGTLGWTEFYDLGPSDVDPYAENWDFARIYINKPEFNTLSSYDKKGTVAHEIGHSMGLAHTTSPYYVMTQLGAGRLVNSAQPNDLAGINYLY